MCCASFCGDLQVGWVLGPARVIQEIHTILPYMQFCVSTPVQEAICTVLQKAEQPYGGESDYYDWLRLQYAGKRAYLESALKAAGIPTLKGEGGFFIIGDVSGIKVCFALVSWKTVGQCNAQGDAWLRSCRDRALD